MKTEKKVQYATYLGVAIFLYFLVVKPLIINRILLNNNHSYTKGKIIGIESAVNGGPDYVFTYRIKNKNHRRSFSKDTRYEVNIGDCYWIKYYPRNPKIIRILLNKPAVCDE